MKIRILTLIILLLFSIFQISALDGFADIFEPEESEKTAESAQPGISFAGDAGLELKTFLDDGPDSEFTAVPAVNLEIKPVTGNLEATIRLKVDGGIMDKEITPADILDELYIQYFFSAGYLEAGLKKTEWGKGDGIHVIDPINPLDQSNGVIPDINEMKDAISMVALNIYAGSNGLLELVYIPLFKGYTLAEEGRWALETPPMIVESVEKPEGLKGSTAAARFTTSAGGIDFGLQYYFGYRPEPGYKVVGSKLTGANPMDPADYTPLTTLVYTQAHLFGIEAGWAAGPFSFRTEAGYWLTEDLDGDLPEYWNNSLVFLGGIDLMVPETNIFISLQATESFVLKYEDRGAADMNTAAAYDGKATTTNIIPAIDIPFFNEKLKLRLAGIYLVEADGWMAAPQLYAYPTDNMEISLSAQFFGGEKDSYYKSWEENGNVALKFKYLF